MCIYSTEEVLYIKSILNSKSGPTELAKMINRVDFLLSRTKSVFVRIFGRANVIYTWCEGKEPNNFMGLERAHWDSCHWRGDLQRLYGNCGHSVCGPAFVRTEGSSEERVLGQRKGLPVPSREVFRAVL